MSVCQKVTARQRESRSPLLFYQNSPEVYKSISVRVEGPEDVITKLLDVPLLEKDPVHLLKLGRCQPPIRAVLHEAPAQKPSSLQLVVHYLTTGLIMI